MLDALSMLKESPIGKDGRALIAKGMVDTAVEVVTGHMQSSKPAGLISHLRKPCRYRNNPRMWFNVSPNNNSLS